MVSFRNTPPAVYSTYVVLFLFILRRDLQTGPTEPAAMNKVDMNVNKYGSEEVGANKGNEETTGTHVGVCTKLPVQQRQQQGAN